MRSLWTRPRRWSWPRAEVMPMATRRKCPSSRGAPSNRSSGSPPGSSSTSMVRPPSRTSSSGRTAHALSSSPFNSYSWTRRSRLEGVGCSAVGSTTSTAFRWWSELRRQPRPRTRSSSWPRTLLSPSVPNRKLRFMCRTPLSSLGPLADRLRHQASAPIVCVSWPERA